MHNPDIALRSEVGKRREVSSISQLCRLPSPLLCQLERFEVDNRPRTIT